VHVRKDSGSFVARGKESGRLAETRRAKEKSANRIVIRLMTDGGYSDRSTAVVTLFPD
jgi:hypothetical protein